MKTIYEIKEWISNRGKVAIFCVGQNGYTFYKILQLLDIKVECFVDNNQNTWNKKIYDDVICYSPSILKNKADYITFICIAPKYYNEVFEQTKKYNIIHIGNVNEIIKDVAHNYQLIYKQLMLELPYTKTSEIFYDHSFNHKFEKLEKTVSNEEKIAVYTSIFGDYDLICEPEYESENIDYYFISDKKPEILNKYKWLDAKKYVPEEIENPVLRNRYVKMHPHLIFPQYKYSIYMDGNVRVLKDLSMFLQKSKLGISVFEHPYRDDIYVEALTVINFKRAKTEDVYNQMSHYLKEKMPTNYGLAEMRIIAREHQNPICIKIMEDWWKEFVYKKSQRDQLSFMYVLWKNGFKLSDMFILGKNMQMCDYIYVNSHK